MSTAELQVFTCGVPRDHKCDDNGPVIYGLTDGTTTDSRERATKEGHTWGSVTCSVCGMSSMDRAMWEGP